jgi:hypothetical protein
MPDRPERRSDPRVGIGVLVHEGAAGAPGALCRAMNLSRTGMYLLRVPEKRSCRSRFAWLGFRLPDGGDSIQALVEVVHTHRLGSLEASGVRFKHLFPADRERIEDYLSRANAA